MGNLGPGDVFFLKNGSYVGYNGRNVEIGHLYDQPRDYSKARQRLRDAIMIELNKAGGNFDGGMVTRFVEYILKDVPASMTLLQEGHFVVTEIRPLNDSNYENVHCKRLHPEPGQNVDHIHFLQTRAGGPTMGYQSVLFTLPPGEY